MKPLLAEEVLVACGGVPLAAHSAVGGPTVKAGGLWVWVWKEPLAGGNRQDVHAAWVCIQDSAMPLVVI